MRYTCLNDSSAFMSKNNVSVAAMLVRSAGSRVRDFDEDFIPPYISGCGRLDNISILRTFEDRESRHCYNRIYCRIKQVEEGPRKRFTKLGGQEKKEPQIMYGFGTPQHGIPISLVHRSNRSSYTSCPFPNEV